jgi:formylglycine-generating enzyme required for sulfatase activity
VPPELANHPKFRVVRELGRGGMGVIYLAQHRVLDKPFALKVINSAALNSAEALARFHAEARAAAKLDHPNIARTHDADQAGDLHFLVMEFIEGHSLAQLLARKGRLPVASACRCVRQAALGLQLAFEAGMVHRDIKPQNLMLTPKGLVKVLDFGLARLRGEATRGPRLTQVDSFMGTPEYVAPEQATDARSADTRADIYSLGCTLYALLTGRPPFQEDTMVKLVLAHIEKEARPLHEVRPDVPPELSAVVAKMLAKDLSQRYQRPVEVALALVPFIKAGGKPSVVGGTVSSGVPATEEKGSPFADLVSASAPKEREAIRAAPAVGRKRRALFVGAGAAALALTVGAFLLGRFLSNHTELPPDTMKVAEDKGENRKDAPPRKAPPLKPLPFVNAAGMAFAWIKPGSFSMGGDNYDREKPVHRVTITREFFMGVYPVTQAQWQAVMGRNPSHFGGDDLPVENVSWDDCQKFCAKLRQRDGRPYRLPYEAEWEYACRAGTATDYYSGDGEDNLLKVGWCNRNSDSRTQPVGKLDPNDWGLSDMHGNVWQWCEDRYGPYAAGDVEDPKGPDRGESRALRGGCWFDDPELCRSAFRYWGAPAFRGNFVGCRVCFRPD